MTHIVQRQDRFYVVASDGLDRLTGKERGRWHLAGHDRTDADGLAARLDHDTASATPKIGGPAHLTDERRSPWTLG